MLTYQKNALLSLTAQLKAKLYDVRADIDDKTNALYNSGKFKKASAHSYIYETIDRNITSIEKQLKRL